MAKVRQPFNYAKTLNLAKRTFRMYANPQNRARIAASFAIAGAEIGNRDDRRAMVRKLSLDILKG